MSIESLTLLALLALGYVGHNMTVVYAVLIVLALKIFAPAAILEGFGAHGLNFGVIILTAAILVPIATGKLTLSDMGAAFQTVPGIIALFCGLFVALIAGRGLNLFQASPEVLPALMIGTMVGVFFFGGLAVGPLIAAGIVELLLQIFGRTQG